MRRLLVAVAVVFSLLISIHVYNEVATSRRQEANLAGPVAPTETDASGVRFRGWADRSRLATSETFSFWIVVENRSGAPMERIELRELKAPGFVPAGQCWRARLPGLAPLPVCRPGEASAANAQGLPPRLDPNEAVGLTAELSPAAGPGGTRVITGVFSWQTSGGAQRQGAVEIGPIQVAHRPASPLAVALTAIYTFFKDLGLPLVLVLLAYLFQQLQHEQAHREETRQHERARREETRQFELARREETRQFFLARATDNAVRYLLPLVSAAESLQECWKKLRTEPAASLEDRRTGLYYLVSFLKLSRDVVTKGGGYLLENLDGEYVIQQAGDLFFDRACSRLGYFELSRALDLRDDHDSVAQFWDEAVRHEATSRLESRFADWVREDPEQSEDLLFLHAQVVLLEINLLFKYWYDERPMDPPHLTEVQKRVAKVAEFKDLNQSVETYQRVLRRHSDLRRNASQHQPSKADEARAEQTPTSAP